MISPDLFGYLALGGITGLLAGYLGIGGGVILVPVLSMLFRSRGYDLGQVMTGAFATSLFTAVFTTSSAAYQQYRQDNLLLQVVPWSAAGAIIGAQAGSWLGSSLSGDVLQISFSLFLLICAMYLVGDWRGSVQASVEVRIRRAGLVAAGVITGVFAALFGVGGGILMVPAFIFIFRFPAGRVAGTSSAVASLIALSGVIGYLFYGGLRSVGEPGFWGVIDYNIAIPIIIGSVSTAGIGARLNLKFGGQVYRRIFALFLAIVAIRMLLMGN